MYPLLLDTKSGKTATPEKWDSSLFWWAEGNGSCDCNRAIAISEEVHSELCEQHGEGTCFGAQRIVAIDVFGDLEGMTKEQVLAEMNQDYPQDIVEAAMARSNTGGKPHED